MDDFFMVNASSGGDPTVTIFARREFTIMTIFVILANSEAFQDFGAG
jgi:hypothetical protein